MACSNRYSLIIAAAITLLLWGCSTRKNTAASRNYQAFITRYNVYYNGDEHYKSTLEAMERDYADDYSRLLPLHPADARHDPMLPQPTGDFTRSIEKAQKAIELRSIKRRPARKPGRSSDPAYREWLKREEYNPFLHNAWLMLGRSQYASGDFTGAAATFRYISRHFSWLPETVTEARLWQARCYSVLGWEFEAESIIAGITTEDLSSRELNELHDITCATMFSASKNPEKAIPHIERAVTRASRWQKPRLYFLLGQLHSRAGNVGEAYAAFGKSSSSAQSVRARLNARVRQSEVYTGSDITHEVKSLKRMTKFGSNRDYLGLLYYAIGNLYKSRGDTAQAVANYKLSLESQSTGSADKASTLLALAEILFSRRDYIKAQPCYAEAVALLPSGYPGYDSISSRSDILDRLAVYIHNINLNDSLLALADKPEEERIAIIKAHIDMLKKRDKERDEAARREEYFSRQQSGNNPVQSADGAVAPSSFSMNTDDSWYFYNPTVRDAGRAEFQRRWGVRRLEDDWRRRDKTTPLFNEPVNDEDDDNNDDTPAYDDDEQSGKSLSPYDVDYYMKQLPLSPEARRNANDIIQDALYNAALILKDDMHDYASASYYWNRLLARYPDSPYCMDVYYNMYMMYRRNGDMLQADRYRTLLLDRYPESRYAHALRDPDGLNRMRDMARREEELYEKAYSAYLDNRNGEVHNALCLMQRDYPLSKLMPKFMFIDALSYVTENDADRFRNALDELVARYPDADVTPIASAYLDGLSRGRRMQGNTNPHGIVRRQTLAADSVAEVSDSIPMFSLNPDTPQLFILSFPANKVDANELLYNVARHNFGSYVIKDFELENLNFGDTGLLIVKGFANFDELVHYRKVLDNDTSFTMPPGVTPVMISVDDFNALVRDRHSIDDYFRYINERAADEPVTVPTPYIDDNDQPQ